MGSPIGLNIPASPCVTPEKQVVRNQFGITRSYEKVEREPIFSGTILPTSKGGALGDEPCRDGFNVAYYTTPSGKVHAIVQQRATGQPCGYGCMLMLFLDRIAKTTDPKSEYARSSRDPHSLIEEFYASDSLTHATHLRSMAERCKTGFTLQVVGFTKRDYHDEDQKIDKRINVATAKGVIRGLKALLKDDHSVVQAITHPKLEGHWVIIDEFAKGFFYLRDPYSAKAYKVSEKELTPMLPKGNFKIEYALQF